MKKKKTKAAYTCSIVQIFSKPYLSCKFFIFKACRNFQNNKSAQYKSSGNKYSNFTLRLFLAKII